VNRGTLKTLIRTYLGTSDDDPAYSDAILNPIVQQAADSLLSSIQDANPDYLVKTPVTLVADTTTSHNYTFATQSPAIADFAKWLEVRYNDEDGAPLSEARLEELRDAGTDFFAITGPDEAPVLVTSKDSPAGTDLYFRYGYWPAELVDDNSVPTGVPSRFHDVVALEALFAFGLGGEQRLPRELYDRWFDRRAQLLSRAGRRGVQNSHSRLVDLDA
jgi:hypothetical protein